MPSAEQIIALLRSHLEEDEERFRSVAMQVAAHEAKLGHKKFADEIRQLVADSRARSKNVEWVRSGRPTPIARPKGELAGLLSVSYPQTRLAEMVLDAAVREKLQRVTKEQRYFSEIQASGLSPRRKLLLLGPPGTGKTMTASCLAGELNLPLFVIKMDGLFTRFLGETASKLRLVFDAIAEQRGVYLFDEFDSIGTQRSATNDVGEVRRVLNNFLQFLEQDGSTSLILAATNHAEILDYALYRRFDDVLVYSKPDDAHIKTVVQNRVAPYRLKIKSWKTVVEAARGLSYAEIVRACDETAKSMLIQKQSELTLDGLLSHIRDRQAIMANLRRREVQDNNP